MRLHHGNDVVDGTLSDNNHAMWVRLAHADGIVTAITGGFTRWPTTGCPGAVGVLQELVGVPVSATRDQLVANGRARRNCTHLYDVALLALAMANRLPGDRLWDAVVPDAAEGRTVATLSLDGKEVLQWPLDEQVIVPPGDQPQSLLKGFARWAAARYDGDLLEGATILRMAAFTARARAHITDNKPFPLRDFPERRGACFAYSDPQVATAVHRQGVVRDFSKGIVDPNSIGERTRDAD
nr:DUF2889 domain-containing protein [uncultured Sphingomonas sp.]